MRARAVILVLFAVAGLVLTLAKQNPAPAGNPVRIDHIEINANYATIHFDTEANRAYTLQATFDVNSGQWVNIFNARAFPFANHYVVGDQLTNKMRSYRLYVVP